MKAYIHLIKYALSNGATVSVMDEESWLLKTSIKYSDIISAIQSVEECTLRFRDADKNILGSAYITPFEDDECTVCDYSVTPFMEQWDTSYNLTISNH
jgi:hypothetical protein